MDCRKLEATLVSKFFEALIEQKKYSAIEKLYKQYEVECKEKEYGVSYTQDKYGVCYCVRYKPMGFIEWILERGRWNDAGIWTEDGIFNDGIV